MGYSSNVFAQFALCPKLEIQKKTMPSSLPLKYMVGYRLVNIWLKYGNEKYTYIFIAMDTDLHSEHTLNTEPSLSTMQRLLTHRASCYGHSYQREGSLGVWHYFLFSLLRVTRSGNIVS